MPRLRHLQVQRAQTGIERALSIPVAPCCAFRAAFMLAGSDQALVIGLHDQLRNGLGDRAKKIAAILLCQKLGKVHVGLGYPMAGRTSRSDVPRGGVSVWFVVEASKLQVKQTVRLCV